MGDGTMGPTKNTRIELVTPELAAEWLKSNRCNRPLSLRQVENIAADIKAGRWRTTHQGAAFGADGSLYDGQHRLHAIVKAGIAVRMAVTRGLDKADLDAIDTGLARRATDIVAMTDGVVLGTNKRAGIIGAHTIVTGNSMRGRVNAATLREAIADHLADYEAVAQSGRMGSHDRLTPSPLLAALTVIHRVAPIAACDFATALRSPDGLRATSPVVQLREFVLVNYYGSGEPARIALIDKTFNAFRAYEDGREVKLLRPAPDARNVYATRWRKIMGRPNPPTE